MSKYYCLWITRVRAISTEVLLTCIGRQFFTIFAASFGRKTWNCPGLLGGISIWAWMMPFLPKSTGCRLPIRLSLYWCFRLWLPPFLFGTWDATLIDTINSPLTKKRPKIWKSMVGNWFMRMFSDHPAIPWLCRLFAELERSFFACPFWRLSFRHWDSWVLLVVDICWWQSSCSLRSWAWLADTSQPVFTRLSKERAGSKPHWRPRWPFQELRLLSFWSWISWPFRNTPRMLCPFSWLLCWSFCGLDWAPRLSSWEPTLDTVKNLSNSLSIPAAFLGRSLINLGSWAFLSLWLLAVSCHSEVASSNSTTCSRQCGWTIITTCSDSSSWSSWSWLLHALRSPSSSLTSSSAARITTGGGEAFPTAAARLFMSFCTRWSTSSNSKQAIWLPTSCTLDTWDWHVLDCLSCWDLWAYRLHFTSTASFLAPSKSTKWGRY